MEIVPFWMVKFFSCLFLLLVLVLQLRGLVIEAQQAYVNNHQLDCDDWDSSTKGYLCDNIKSSCQSYITLRSNPPYTSPATIGYLLVVHQEATLIASINNISSDIATTPTNTQVIVPVNCSCYKGLYYQYNATYTLKDENENYFTLANDTYQGLTTCQALRDQNPFGYRNLYAGLDIHVPLRCACPTSNQTALGANYMLTYMVTWGDTISEIAKLFNATEQSVLDANKLLADDLIFPFAPILVPIESEPSLIELPVDSLPPARSPPLDFIPVEKSDSSKKWVPVSVGTGLAFLVLAAFFSGLLCYFRHGWSKKAKPMPLNKLPAISFSEVQYATEHLMVYKFDDMQTATGFFSEDNRIKGSVYRASFKGDSAAIKVMKGDVSGEIDILKNINHFNIIRLPGLCVHKGNTYLADEYAENGSLNEWLHSNKYAIPFILSWKQRVQIAYDVADALNYLHIYTNPPFVHKNLKPSNILLDSNFRAKIANFGLARTLVNDDEDVLQLTTHVVGTHVHMAPEYIEDGLITSKLDVFAYGVVMLELLSGKEAIISEENKAEKMLSTLINQVLEEDNVREKLIGFIDPFLRDDIPVHLAFHMTQLAKSCVSHDPNSRPTMSEVFMTLSKILCSLLD